MQVVVLEGDLEEWVKGTVEKGRQVAKVPLWAAEAHSHWGPLGSSRDHL